MNYIQDGNLKLLPKEATRQFESGLGDILES